MSFRGKLHSVIFGTESPAGKLFDVVLLWAIVLSVLAVVLESVPHIRDSYGPLLTVLEWVFTLLFTVEYLLRIYCVNKPVRYIFSFYGIVDFVSIVPTYLSLFVSGTQAIMVVRAARLLRVFRVLKLARHLGEATELKSALIASRHKITVFLGAVGVVILVVGSLMYLVEGPSSGFTSIPKGMYWAVVTLTTVGYGDITPQSPVGQTLSAFVMILGYGIIAVPTGIVTSELAKVSAEENVKMDACAACGRVGHAVDAVYCKYCGDRLRMD